MEDSSKVGGVENGSSSEGRPPNPLAAAYRQCFSTELAASPCKKSLVRHPSLVSLTSACCYFAIWVSLI